MRSDWETFQQPADQGWALETARRSMGPHHARPLLLPRRIHQERPVGPDCGFPDQENALDLVRGRPFEGDDFPWTDSVQQEMLSRIVDVAHTLAAWHTDSDTPDLDAARHAALRGLDIGQTAEVLYRDWMTIEWAAENTAGVRKAVARVQ